MSKYINLELALNELLRLYEEDVDAFGVEIPETFDYRRAKEALNNIPTIDIVRCKDCKYYVSDGGAIMECEIYEVPTEDNHYCGYGERKEE